MAQKAVMMVRPAILMESEAFRNGYDVAQQNTEYIGWPIKHTPREDSIVQFVRDMCDILEADNYGEYETRWIAGLFAGWLTREVPYTRG